MPAGGKSGAGLHGAEEKRSPRTVQDARSNPESEVDAAGPLPTSPEALHRRLDDLGIAYRSVSHPPVFTVEEAKALRGELPGPHIKNLFLRNKTGQMWLVTCLEDRAVDLKGLGERLGAALGRASCRERVCQYV